MPKPTGSALQRCVEVVQARAVCAIQVKVLSQHQYPGMLPAGASPDSPLAPEDTAVRAYARQRSLRQQMPIAICPRRGSVAGTSADARSLASAAAFSPTDAVHVPGGMSRSTSVHTITGSLRLNDPYSGGFSGRAR